MFFAQSKAKFFELSKKAYRTSAKVEHTLNMLAAMRQVGVTAGLW